MKLVKLDKTHTSKGSIRDKKGVHITKIVELLNNNQIQQIRLNSLLEYYNNMDKVTINYYIDIESIGKEVTISYYVAPLKSKNIVIKKNIIII